MTHPGARQVLTGSGQGQVQRFNRFGAVRVDEVWVVAGDPVRGGHRSQFQFRGGEAVQHLPDLVRVGQGRGQPRVYSIWREQERGAVMDFRAGRVRGERLPETRRFRLARSHCGTCSPVPPSGAAPSRSRPRLELFVRSVAFDEN